MLQAAGETPAPNYCPGDFRLRYLLIGSVLNETLLENTIRDCGPIFHLASAVGVKLILERPVQSIETIVKGTNSVLNLASRYRKPVLIASTSEVYGKSTALPFRED